MRLEPFQRRLPAGSEATEVVDIKCLAQRNPVPPRAGFLSQNKLKKQLTPRTTGYKLMSAIHSRASCAVGLCEPIHCFPHLIELGLIH
jgi:hypothetical protein